MSLPGASGKDLNPNPDPNPTPPDGALDGSDPLLQSGAFIDASTMEESQEVGKAQSNGTADGSAGRAKAKGSDPMSMDWLPAGWRVEYKVRSSGATAGSTDRVRFWVYFLKWKAFIEFRVYGNSEVWKLANLG